MTEGTRWFRRFVKDCKRVSPHVRVKRVKLGFYRIYFKQAYIGEVYKEMPLHGYDINDMDPRFASQRYYEEYEDNAELTRKIKNFVEGYWESLDRLKTRVYMMHTSKEFAQRATNAYKQMKIK